MGENSKIELASYYKSTGFIMRCEKENPELIAYLRIPPTQAFEILFPRYFVTGYKELSLFGSSDFEETTPMRGLLISNSNIPNCYGIQCYGQVEKLHKIKGMWSVRRPPLDIVPEIKHILDYLNTETPNRIICNIRANPEIVKEVNFILENLL